MLTLLNFYAIHTFIWCNYILLNDMLKLFSLAFHKIYESLTKNNVSNIEIFKEPNKNREPCVTCGYIW